MRPLIQNNSAVGKLSRQKIEDRAVEKVAILITIY
jgi:hypothetical protein